MNLVAGKALDKVVVLVAEVEETVEELEEVLLDKVTMEPQVLAVLQELEVEQLLLLQV